MQNQNQNPFVLPGLGQSGDMASNPLLASMEMMRQAWQGLAGAGGLEHNLGVPMSVEDLDRRINDLRAVENWLRLNLSMLTSTIQGLEVQRSTIATLKSFMGGAEAPSPSAFEALWGKGSAAQGKKAGGGQGTGPGEAAPAAGGDAPKEETPGTEGAQAAGANAAGAVPGMSPDVAAQALAASQNWWNMVQQQFDNLAAATAATLQGAETVPPGGTAATETTMGKKASKPASASARTARKPAARKAPARKSTAARKSTRKADPQA